MFQTLIYPSSGVCDFAVELPHPSLCSVNTKDFGISVHLWCLVVCVWCDVLCRFVVVGRCIFIDIDRFLLYFVIIVFTFIYVTVLFILFIWNKDKLTITILSSWDITIAITLFWIILSCWAINIYQHFGGVGWLQIQRLSNFHRPAWERRRNTTPSNMSCLYILCSANF
jgi:hypothetical protein